jgi:predicted GNAT family N-acyltransferase
MRIQIRLDRQELDLYGADGALIRRYSVSTARNGSGEMSGSGCTPRGRHIIRAIIGRGAALGTAFKGRRPTGEIWSPALAAANPEKDWILSRILWLSGLEPGKNRLGALDSMRRYIYIHGTGDDQPMGVPLSIGCIRMRDREMVELAELVLAGTPVNILEHAPPELEILDWPAARPLALPLRLAIFVAEQGVPLEMEEDGADPVSRHAALRNAAGEVIATGRLLSDGHIGRLAVRRDRRGQGLGARVLTALLAEAARLGMDRLILHAQTPAEGFYRRFGFVPVGEVFMEAGLPHIAMTRGGDR